MSDVELTRAEQFLAAFSAHADACDTCRDPSRQESFELDELCDEGAESWSAFADEMRKHGSYPVLETQ